MSVRGHCAHAPSITTCGSVDAILMPMSRQLRRLSKLVIPSTDSELAKDFEAARRAHQRPIHHHKFQFLELNKKVVDPSVD